MFMIVIAVSLQMALGRGGAHASSVPKPSGGASCVSGLKCTPESAKDIVTMSIEYVAFTGASV